MNGRTVDLMSYLLKDAKPYDSEGCPYPGLNLVANGTGRPEPVLTSQQWADMAPGLGTLDGRTRWRGWS